jgi:hypothetical protein
MLEARITAKKKEVDALVDKAAAAPRDARENGVQPL